ncbi:hypothetical protein ACHAXR_003074, partial [Thalassiosira sp. AJA248-18]
HNNNQRQLSVALPQGGCMVTYAKLSKRPIPPTWQASFPGSGARMTWSLVEALTGLRTNDDYDSHERGYEKVVAVKTHYPIKNARRQFPELDKLFGRAMVILRNPINAIPSYFNQQYERIHHLPTHSTRGPNEDWIKYRDDPEYGLSGQLIGYERFVEYWMEKYPARQVDLLMVSYEDLTDTTMGPRVAMRIANFLGETNGVNPIAPESIPCVWETIVNFKNVAPPPPPDQVPKDGIPVDEEEADDARKRQKIRKLGGNNYNNRRVSVDEEQDTFNANRGKTFADPSYSMRTGPKVRSYTQQNLDDMVAMFQRLMEKYSFDEDFSTIMASYIETVSSTAPQGVEHG